MAGFITLSLVNLFSFHLQYVKMEVRHYVTDAEDGLTEEQAEEIIDYYYRRRCGFSA